MNSWKKEKKIYKKFKEFVDKASLEGASDFFSVHGRYLG